MGDNGMSSDKQITNATRIEMITSIAVPKHQQMTHPASKEYTIVCKKLVCGNGYVSKTFTIMYNLKTHYLLTITCS